MDQLLLYGGTPLFGTIEAEGAKNAALPILFATMLSRGVTVLHRVPNIGDVEIALSLLQGRGASVKRLSAHTLEIDTSFCTLPKNPSGNGDKIRGSLYLLGAELARFGEAFCPFPGGCNLGSRPIDQHLKVLSALGADISVEAGGIHVRGRRLRGTAFTFDIVSVGATVNAMLAATQAEGTTVLYGASREPHVVDVAEYLTRCGCPIQGAGTDRVIIRGNCDLHGCTHSIVGDMMEAGTYLIAGVATGGTVTVRGVVPSHLDCLSEALCQMGASVSVFKNSITAKGSHPLHPIRITTGPYPAFPTDLHPQMVALMAKAEGISQMNETIWRERFRYLQELKKMGLSAKEKDATLSVYGGKRLQGGIVEATDLRGGAAAVTLGLMAEGMTLVNQAEMIERGYEHMAEKLTLLGGKAYLRRRIYA